MRFFTLLVPAASHIGAAGALGTTGDRISTSYDPTDTPSQITLGNGSMTLLQFAYSDVPSRAIAGETDTCFRW